MLGERNIQPMEAHEANFYFTSGFNCHFPAGCGLQPLFVGRLNRCLTNQ